MEPVLGLVRALQNLLFDFVNFTKNLLNSTTLSFFSLSDVLFNEPNVASAESLVVLLRDHL